MPPPGDVDRLERARRASVSNRRGDVRLVGEHRLGHAIVAAARQRRRSRTPPGPRRPVRPPSRRPIRRPAPRLGPRLGAPLAGSRLAVVVRCQEQVDSARPARPAAPVRGRRRAGCRSPSTTRGSAYRAEARRTAPRERLARPSRRRGGPNRPPSRSVASRPVSGPPPAADSSSQRASSSVPSRSRTPASTDAASTSTSR